MNAIERLDAYLDALRRRSRKETQCAPQHVNRLVLHVVVLQGERMARLDVQDLAHVVIRLRPDQLMTPRLLNPARRVAP